MATCRDIVTRALVMVGVVARGDTPEAEELNDGMTILQSIYDQWLIGGMFGRLNDKFDEGDTDVAAGQRVYVSDGIATLPDFTDTGCRWRDLAAIEVFDTNGRRVYLWDRTDWVRIDALEPTDRAPLSDRGANGLAACVALLYAEEFGAQVGPGAARQAGTFKYALSVKSGSTRDPVPGQYF